MGVLNINSDSFFKGSRVTDETALMHRVEQMIVDGVTVIDVGGMSSRPGATIISASEEMARISPAVKAIRTTFPNQVISIDTVWGDVADWAIDQGVHMINDISAWEVDPRLLEVVGAHNVPYILMHMQGLPNSMQKNPVYDDVVLTVLDFLIEKVGRLLDAGVFDVIVDPGFGFGKSVDDNYKLLQNLHVLKILDRPILVGMSRKSMIQKVLEVDGEQALNGTTALHMIALQQGAQILRTHDVKEAVQCVKLWQKLQENGTPPAG
ncbi:UNVERIFIED_CONTAM: hypothetical protein GTU68_041225 [Idotea baltica]|nr:hypothetical protein [Idotea baltica]